MQITEVKITLKDEEKLKAYASITFDNAFVVRGMKVINGNTGFFISMPSRKKSDGTYQDIAHPINNETREMIESAILEKYKEAIEQRTLEAGAGSQAPPSSQPGPAAPAKETTEEL
jgi:stage V sporulation protein G